MAKQIDIELVASKVIQDRFWAKVDMSGDCWIWTGDKNENDYGVLYLKESPFYAHRISWAIAHKEDPARMMVCHTCDTPSCVRDSHLFLGTAWDNNTDMINKGRGRWLSGQSQPLAKFTDSDVLHVRNLYATGKYTTQDLSSMYAVDNTTIHSILLGKSYRSAGGPLVETTRSLYGENHHLAKLTDDKVIQIRSLHVGGTSQNRLSKLFGVSRQAISMIVKGETWKHVG